MYRVLMILAMSATLLSTRAYADDLFPLDKIALGMDVKAVESMAPDLQWGPVEKTPSGDVTRGVAIVRCDGRFWNGSLVSFGNGAVESLAYSRSLGSVTDKQEAVPLIFRELLTRYGKPDQVLACQQPAMKGMQNEPLFVWRRDDKVIAFQYTPFASTTGPIGNVVLQVMLPSLPLDKRYKVVDVPASEMDRLTVDVAGIVASPTPAASSVPVAKPVTTKSSTTYIWPAVGAVILALVVGILIGRKTRKAA